MKMQFKAALALAVVVVFASCQKDSSLPSDVSTFEAERNPMSEVIVIKKSGDINSALDEFRALLGPLNTAPSAPGTPGLETGRREVNWDGVQAPNLNNNNFPGDFFGSSNPLDGNARKRGIICSTPGSGLRVSDNDLADIDPSYPGQFQAFSPAKIFVSEGSPITDARFKVPGTVIDAAVNAFGVVFSDVDHGGSTSILFYKGSELLGEFKAPRKGKDGFSFLGIYFPHEFVTRVRIVSGTHSIGKDVVEMGKDLVVMDDFIYSEPRSF
ncbi:MAG TPA: hypothetical protein VFX58_07785 [Chitinophagaceae bacterium]|nr:hypothetical protein [Chitinophagaceae bacterium]